MTQQRHLKQTLPSTRIYDEEFFDDMHMIFMGMGRGEASKYMYDDNGEALNNNLWERIVTSSVDYYVPQADNALLKLARPELSRHIPSGTPYIDFGIGGQESFMRYVLPTMNLLGSTKYIGVDFDHKILAQAESLQSTIDSIEIETVHVDFFKPSHRILSPAPALGVMNGITLGNMYGALNDRKTEDNLTNTLKHLSQLTNYGWLLISIDTNQNEDSLMKMYLTPLNSHLNIASLPRMAMQLPVKNFDPTLFDYCPEWRPEQQLVAHMAVANDDQNFTLGDYAFDVSKGQKIHLFNSYKFRQDFFESCCPKVNLAIVQSWKHDSGVMLYLLKNSI